MQWIIIRSKKQSIINEEISNKYFYLCKQQKETKKHIKQLQNDKNEKFLGMHIFLSNNIHQTSKLRGNKNQLLTKILNKLQTQQNEKIRSYINKNELKQAINQMENNKSPGLDRIPIEFYKTFYEVIENDLLQLYKSILFIEKKYYKNYATSNHYINLISVMPWSTIYQKPNHLLLLTSRTSTLLPSWI